MLNPHLVLVLHHQNHNGTRNLPVWLRSAPTLTVTWTREARWCGSRNLTIWIGTKDFIMEECRQLNPPERPHPLVPPLSAREIKVKHVFWGVCMSRHCCVMLGGGGVIPATASPSPQPFNLSFDANSTKSDHHTPECTCVRPVGLRCARRRARRSALSTPPHLCSRSTSSNYCVLVRKSRTRQAGRAIKAQSLREKKGGKKKHLSNALTSRAGLPRASAH